MKKIFITLILGLFLLSFASAIDWSTAVSNYNLDDSASPLIDSTHLMNFTEQGIPLYQQPGKINYSIEFDNTSDFFNSTCPSNLDFGLTEDFSVSYWVKTIDTNNRRIFESSNSQPRYSSNLEVGGYLTFEVATAGGSDRQYYNSNTNISDGLWHNIIFTRGNSGQDGYLYIDNLLVNYTLSQPTKNASCSVFNFGDNDGSSSLLMNLDEFTVWNKSLSKNDRLDIYNGNLGLAYDTQPKTQNNRLIINSIELNNSYETDLDLVAINVSDNFGVYDTITANLDYSGTSYSLGRYNTTNSSFFNTTVNVPLYSPTQYNVTWNFTLTNSTGTFYDWKVYSVNNQQVNFTICDGTFTTQFLNISFKDESDSSTLNASVPISSFEYYLGNGIVSKIYSYTSTENNFTYTFCASPTDRIFNVKPIFQYKQGTEYPQRAWEDTVQRYTSTLSHKVLYLLSNLDGIYTTFITATQGNTAIEGVLVTATRSIGGSDVVVTQGTSDSAGSVTFWLNPNYDHEIVATKTGYGTGTVTVRPTQSTYTITLSSGLSNYTYVNDYAGLKWFVFPSIGIRNESTATNYGFNITAENDNIDKCKIQLLDKSKTILLSEAETIATNSSICSVQTSYTINSTYSQVKGRLLIDLGDGYKILEEDAYWRLEIINTTGMTFTDWFNTLKEFDLRYFNENEQHREYTQILLFFLVVMILCAGLNAMGWDIQTNGGMVFVVGALIWMASIPGFLTLSYITPFRAFDQYFLAGIYSMFMGGYAIKSFL